MAHLHHIADSAHQQPRPSQHYLDYLDYLDYLAFDYSASLQLRLYHQGPLQIRPLGQHLDPTSTRLFQPRPLQPGHLNSTLSSNGNAEWKSRTQQLLLPQAHTLITDDKILR
ncbi:hypothetical protein PENSTE_c011G06466 [Penicillium steckii]|uniref:Uncharacterized protein n=1 Tax=Penicillium steckii TaxID=303698 RepID=A0A1V6T691_9EURO|nr:hypothetical protein PENSTE_c011G06466 [Penicillium steckii]